MKGTNSLFMMDVEFLGFGKQLVDAAHVHRLEAVGKDVTTEVVAFFYSYVCVYLYALLLTK